MNAALKKIMTVTSFLSITILVGAQILPPRTPSAFNVKQLHCGHSLTSPLFGPWPGQYTELVADENGLAGWQILGTMVGKADLPGAWLTMHWNYTTSPCWPTCYEPNSNPVTEISNWELLVITENFEGPANNSLNLSKENLLNFVDNSWQNGNSGAGAPTMLWTNWPGIDGSAYFFNGYGIPESTDGTAAGWRQLLDLLEDGGTSGTNGWQVMQDYANNNRMNGCPPVYIIPDNRMTTRFYDDVQASLVPTITHVNQIFTDGVHTNDIGAYMISMIHYACIFGQSPVGISNNLHASVTIDPSLATYIQNMVWDVVTNYPRSGIVGTASVNEAAPARIKVFPNPVSDVLNVEIEGLSQSKEIFDMQGNKLLVTDANTIDLSKLAKGFYLLVIGDEQQMIVKQ
jgi:hypothetical protein